MISVGIIGGSGYTGKKLIQFCNSHPYINEYSVYGLNSINKKITDIFPELSGMVVDSTVKSLDSISNSHDVIFVSLPNGEALKIVPDLLSTNNLIIDLGGDFRLNSAEEYAKWYNIEHSSPSLLMNKVYGLADLPDIDYSNTNLIANPGCYPTAALLSLLPLVSNYSDNIISITTNAYSGTSGAGKTPKTHLMMAEMDGNVYAYNVKGHRHFPEILQVLNSAGNKAPYSFTTHLLPVAVGIYSTSVLHLKYELDEAELQNIYKLFYKESAFVRLREIPPQLSWVVNTNYFDLNITINRKVIVLTAAIDNLIKGASGQAIQNMNKIFGWSEEIGLTNRKVQNVLVY